MAYYYFAATLPRVTFDGPNAIDVERFAEMCTGRLADVDMEAVTAIKNGSEDKSGNSALSKWMRSENRLRFSIAKIRATRLKKDFAEIARESNEHDPELDKEVIEAYSRHTPLEREIAFDRIRWRFCEELHGIDSFSAAFVISYALKLKIADRWQRMNSKTGNATLEKAISERE